MQDGSDFALVVVMVRAPQMSIFIILRQRIFSLMLHASQKAVR